ncbi:hypothetical protein NL533_31475, partial [Klebsiella pneumoniae]|nr:hypothetical protein [Klebsiella pneumoniae]
TKGLTEKQIEVRSTKAYGLLHSFDMIPGSDRNGKVNYDVIIKWCNAVIDLSKKAKRGYWGYYYIGELLAKGIEKDKIPPDEICRVIEKIY